jgi:hypothetical protein
MCVTAQHMQKNIFSTSPKSKFQDPKNKRIMLLASGSIKTPSQIIDIEEPQKRYKAKDANSQKQ